MGKFYALWKNIVIDNNGFRLNVGMVLINSRGQSFWGRRANHPGAWQFPQGGINAGETEQQAMYRELAEELGLSAEDVQILGRTQEWLFYELPTPYQRAGHQPLCIGQKQKWFLLRLCSSDSRIQLECSEPPEFDRWCWVDFWYPLSAVIEFKREVYREVLKQFAPLVSRGDDLC